MNAAESEVARAYYIARIALLLHGAGAVKKALADAPQIRAMLRSAAMLIEAAAAVPSKDERDRAQLLEDCAKADAVDSPKDRNAEAKSEAAALERLGLKQKRSLFNLLEQMKASSPSNYAKVAEHCLLTGQFDDNDLAFIAQFRKERARAARVKGGVARSAKTRG